MSVNTVFVSHTHEDADFARVLKEWLDETFLGAVECFVSSSPESLGPGTDWPELLKKNLQNSSLSLVLLSPGSLARPWLNFEAGAAYVRGVPVIPICIAGLKVADLAAPLSFLQAIQLDVVEDQRTLLTAIGRAVGLRTPKNIEVPKLPARTSEMPPRQMPRQA